MNTREKCISTFRQRFGSEPAVVIRAPGRVNLIGEHTDYNDGFVMPLAINRAIWLALRPRNDRLVKLYSIDFDAEATFDLAALAHTDAGWSEYVKGTAWALGEAGLATNGWEGVLHGDIPAGAGLSSSAALELASARAFQQVAGWEWDPKAIALLCQKVENQWIGVNSGIMDQMISAAGQTDRAVLIDCRSLELTPVPIPAGTAVVILDTTTRRGLVDSAYNERRTQSESVATFFGVAKLRDVTSAQLSAVMTQLEDLPYRRAKHVIEENERVLAAADAMQDGDAASLGLLMNASHASLRDDFEVSSSALDAIVACAQSLTGCYGARMTGGGFAGCGVALVATEHADQFARDIAACYEAATGMTPNIYITEATAGAAPE